MSGESVILFHSSNYAMWAADALKKAKIGHKLVPVPRELSSDCGYCVRFDTLSAGQVSALMEKENIEFDRIEQI
ncbi:MAG: DUF3343 domain-containing protein [Candidatus Delongbacteria bacterium]|jgi:hypothetical protein|nr:DUF3343 domain-containing protein [Candidatus Delongbacteria bacterium]MDD4204955.1 DUF3343 domain-containing protein [Candidatus Delongbacteria bacterium]MDY0017108.1 DUF3343 domain-containing protein [Candidatus Delongbacteria bacterium]